MKKIYNSPELKVVKIATMGMIAGSAEQSLSGADEFSGGGELTGSRSYDAWDDDEEDME
ncbi:MAG: hypothetical protein IJ081_02725 [Prevotella sp.]|nr:hypothetical protein [Prevotella sp.]